jgi:hypothetical protein
MSYEDLKKGKVERGAKEIAKRLRRLRKRLRRLRERQSKLVRARVHVAGSARVLRKHMRWSQGTRRRG